MFAAELIQKVAKRFELLAAGFIHVDGEIPVDTAARRLQEFEAVGLHRDRLQSGRVEKLLLREARDPLVHRPSAAAAPPGIILLDDADHLVEIAEAAQRGHLFRSVVVADADLPDSDFPHLMLPISSKNSSSRK